MDILFSALGFFFCLGACGVSRLSVPWLFGWFWLLGFSVSGLLGHSTSYSFLALYGLLASWFSLAFRPLGLSRLFYRFVYYIILCYNKFHEYIYIYIYICIICSPPPVDRHALVTVYSWQVLGYCI